MSGFGGASRVIPVVVMDDASRAPNLAAALRRGGIGCAEVTLRTDAALDAIRVLADGADDLVVGAGTVLSVGDADAAARAGARFVVSPGFDPAIVDRARELGLDVLPGVATASEVQHARRHGVHTVKFFPADRLGGLATISALAAPFGDMGFVPSGGVSPRNVREYLAHPAVPAVSGSWMVDRSLITQGDFAAIERLSGEAVALARTPEGDAGATAP
jgi:2-dehydro-3-deoxyphosphogluconate aldolase/(4S)-4-hydroxy-2-oxoglutarate aldolase